MHRHIRIIGAGDEVQRLGSIRGQLEFLRHLTNVTVVRLHVVEWWGVAAGQEVEEQDVGFEQILRLELLFVEVRRGRAERQPPCAVIHHQRAVAILIARGHVDRRGIGGVAVMRGVSAQQQRLRQRRRAQQRRAGGDILIDEILPLRGGERVMAHQGRIEIAGGGEFQLGADAGAVGLALGIGQQVEDRLADMAVIAGDAIAEDIVDRAGNMGVDAVFAVAGAGQIHAELLRRRGRIGDEVDHAGRGRAPAQRRLRAFQHLQLGDIRNGVGGKAVRRHRHAVHLDRHARGEADGTLVGVGGYAADRIGYAAVEGALDFHRGDHAVDVRQVGNMLLGDRFAAHHRCGDGDLLQLFRAFLRGDDDFGGVAGRASIGIVLRKGRCCHRDGQD